MVSVQQRGFSKIGTFIVKNSNWTLAPTRSAYVSQKVVDGIRSSLYGHCGPHKWAEARWFEMGTMCAGASNTTWRRVHCDTWGNLSDRTWLVYVLTSILPNFCLPHRGFSVQLSFVFTVTFKLDSKCICYEV